MADWAHGCAPRRSHTQQRTRDKNRSVLKNQEKNGGGRAYLLEQQALSVSLKREVSWARKSIDLALLAKLRQVDELKLDDIAEKIAISRSTVDRGMRRLRARQGG